MTISLNNAVDEALYERFMANRMSAEEIGDIVDHGYNAKSLDKIFKANGKLVEACLVAKDDITHCDIFHPLESVVKNDIDWLAHLDFAFALAHAAPKELKSALSDEFIALGVKKVNSPAEEPKLTARQKLLALPYQMVTIPKQDPRQVSVASFLKAFDL